MNFSSPEQNIERLHLRSGMVVADLGAGSGHYSIIIGKKLKEMGGGGTVYAVDVQKHYLDAIKQEADKNGLGNVRVIWGDIDVLGGTKLADNLADAVVISNVLFQSEHKKDFLAEASRILKPGGEMLIIDWQSKIKPQDILSILPPGVSKTSEFDAGSHHFGILFRKS